MFRFLQVMILLSVVLFATESSAQIFDVKVKDYGFNTSTYPELKSLVDEQLATVVADINKGLPSTDPDRMMEGTANASVMAGKGIGTDYASNMNVFLIGAGIGAGADLYKDKNTDGDLSGANAASGLIMGLNLGFLDAETILGMDTDRLNVYVNYSGYDYKTTLNDKEGEKSTADLNMTSGGIHFRYQLVQNAGTKLFGWGGVKVHWGYEYNKTKISFKSELSKKLDDESFSGTITGAPTAEIDTVTHSFPLALSTDVQLLYFLSLYTGLGADYSTGYAKARGALNGSDSTITCTSGTECTAAGNPTIKVQPTANIDGKGKVNPFLFRGFAGVQVNLPWTRIFVQVDKAFGNDLIGATAGVRFAF